MGISQDSDSLGVTEGISDTVDLYGYNAVERQTFSDEERKGEKAGAMSLSW